MEQGRYEETQIPMVGEAIEQSSVDIAWNFRFAEGDLSMSWEAFRVYGLSPIVPVQSSGFEDDLPMVAHGVPRINIIIVAPDEMRQLAAHLSPDDNYGEGEDMELEPGDGVFGLDVERIDVVLALDITRQDSFDDQEAFFEQLFEDNWSEAWSKLLSTDAGYNFMMAHGLAESSRRGAFATLVQYRDRGGLDTTQDLADLYCQRVFTSVHGVFCEDSHDNQEWRTSTPSL